MSRAHHTDIPFPHAGGCVECRGLEICNCCGFPAPKAIRCTNGHCTHCHQIVCTPGGITYPGHGHGSRDSRVEQAQLMLKQRSAKRRERRRELIISAKLAQNLCADLLAKHADFTVVHIAGSGWHFDITEDRGT